MNIIEACKLLDKFGGYISAIGAIRFGAFLTKDFTWVTNGKDGALDFDICEPRLESLYRPKMVQVLANTWLYCNDKFECLTCTVCYKLLEDMEGVGPVCNCEKGKD